MHTGAHQPKNRTNSIENTHQHRPPYIIRMVLTNPLTGSLSQFSTVCPFINFPVYQVEYPARCMKSGSVCCV